MPLIIYSSIEFITKKTKSLIIIYKLQKNKINKNTWEPTDMEEVLWTESNHPMFELKAIGSFYIMWNMCMWNANTPAFLPPYGIKNDVIMPFVHRDVVWQKAWKTKDVTSLRIY